MSEQNRPGSENESRTPETAAAPEQAAPAAQPPAAPDAHHHDEHEPMPEGEEEAPPGTHVMAIVRWLLILAMAAVAGASIAYYAGWLGSGLSQAAVRYQCPMHPSVLQDHPGDCPICGMSLVEIGPSGKESDAKKEGGAQAKAPAAGHEGHRHDPADPYYCPMCPEETSPDGTGRCPVCKMKFEKRPEGMAAPLPPGHEGHRHNPADPYYCSMCPDETSPDGTGRCPVCKMKFEKRPATAQAASAAPLPPGHEGHRHNAADAWICPMHPEETSPDGTGRCPLCKMKFEKRPAAAGAHAAHGGAIAAEPGQGVPGLVPVELSPERVQLIGMKTGTVTREELVTDIRTVGVLAAPEEGLAHVHTRFSGWLENVAVGQTGERVEKGQVLASVYSPELFAAQQEFLNARRWAGAAGAPAGGEAAELSTGLAADARRRLELMGISPQEIAEIERTGQPVRAMKIRSPVSGYVVARGALPGLYVQPGTELFQVADLSRIWLLADVYESEVGRVRVGQRARLTLASFPGRPFQGRVEFIYPALDPQSRTLKVRLGFANPGLQLRPGMYGDVSIELSKARGLVVPLDAVVDTGQHRYVFLAREGGRFEPRSVVLGLRSGNKVEVLQGLKEGDTVVTTANFLIDSESRLRSAIEGQGEAAKSDEHAGHGR